MCVLYTYVSKMHRYTYQSHTQVSIEFMIKLAVHAVPNEYFFCVVLSATHRDGAETRKSLQFHMFFFLHLIQFPHLLYIHLSGLSSVARIRVASDFAPACTTSWPD